MKHSRVATDAKSLTTEEKARKAEAMIRAKHTDHDCWGPCCWGCQWYGEATKPCHCCEEWREALR